MGTAEDLFERNTKMCELCKIRTDEPQVTTTQIKVK